MASLASSDETYKRIVIKIGSALLVDQGIVRQSWLNALADDVSDLRDQGVEVVIVSSGAIAVGRERLGLEELTLRLDEKQASAAVGQIALAQAYADAMSHHNITVGQVLITLSDTEERRRFLNARDTICTLIESGVVPVINENDTVTTSEIRYGDNDRLSARVASMIDADLLILLSDIDGLYSANPKTDDSAEHIPRIERLTPEIEEMPGELLPGYSSGGMKTKLLAARIAMHGGCDMVICDGQTRHAIAALFDGAQHSLFVSEDAREPRKRWIGDHLNCEGAVTIDAGAARALINEGSSLLPVGCVGIEGQFGRGDVVTIVVEGQVIGRGLVAFDASDAELILGKQSEDLEDILGYSGRPEMIHRDDLVLETQEENHG